MKIKTIQIENFKAIEGFKQIDLQGCSVLVTAANRKGKTSILQGIIDRIRGLRPSRATNENAKEGKGIIELDNGEKFKWEFDKEGLDKLVYITKDGYASRVTKEISKKYFPMPFDIDEFMLSQPKGQLKMLAELVGLDFTEIDLDYEKYYQLRTVANKAEEVAKVKYESITVIPEKIEFVNSKSLVDIKKELTDQRENQYLENKKINEGIRKELDLKKDGVRKSVKEFNELQEKRINLINECEGLLQNLECAGYKGMEVRNWIDMLPKNEKKRSEEEEIEKLEEPKYIVPELPGDGEIVMIDIKINDLNAINEKAKEWKDYCDTKTDYDVARVEANKADEKVKEVIERKKEMIRGANLPKGIEFGEEGVLVDGYLLNDQNTSTSQKYCAAIRLGALKLGEVGALHFDASTLDKKSLLEIEDWANNFPGIEGGLQLLVERPSWDEQEIRYEIIQNKK